MPSSVSVAARNQSYPNCDDCPAPDAAAVAILVFFPGVGSDVQGGRFTYTAAETAFVDDLKDRIGNDTTACCRKTLLTASYDPHQSAAQNASRLAAIIDGLVDLEAMNDWVTRIHIHLIGFSAGGIVATQTAAALDCSVRYGRVARPNQYTYPGWDTLPDAEELPPARWWCGHGDQLALEIPVHVDVVTMATPFKIGGALSPLLSFFAPIGTFFAHVLDILLPFNLTFRASLGENDYGGAAPSCLCNFVSFVTSGAYDEEWGADKDPTQDSRLDAWGPKAVPLPAVPELTHTGVPAEVLRTAPSTLDAGCNCTSAP